MNIRSLSVSVATPLFLIAFIVLLTVNRSTLNAADHNAMGRVSLSSTSIALNESVTIDISSLELIADTDIQKIITTTLELPNNRKTWKLVGAITIKRKLKTKSFTAHFQVRPRISGELKLPDLPARWQKGNSIMKLGRISVRDAISIGNEDKVTPSELVSVGGFAWDLTYAQLQKKIGKGEIIRTGDYEMHTTKSGLELMIRQRQLSGARITLEGWYLRQARFNFIDRWGEPTFDLVDSNAPRLTWALGWLSIIVSEQVIDGTPRLSIDITREDIEDRLVQSSVKRKVFKLLENDQSSDELWEKAEENSEVVGSTTPPVATVAKPIEEIADPTTADTTTTSKNTTEDENAKSEQQHLEQLYKEALKNMNP